MVVVDSSWNVMAHGDTWEGKWRGNWPVPFTLPRNMVYPALLPLMCTPRLPVVDWTDAPADLNGLVRFAERPNLISARVPSHFNWPLLCDTHQYECEASVTLRHTYLGPFSLDPEDVRSLSLGATRNFIKEIWLPWLPTSVSGAQRASQRSTCTGIKRARTHYLFYSWPRT